MPALDLDTQLRVAAFAALTRYKALHDGAVTRTELQRGYEFGGERIPLFNAQRGIWRPRQLGSDAAALTLVTAPPTAGRRPPYDDEVGSDDVRFHYKYQRRGPDEWDNVAVRRAMELKKPLIYLKGIVPGLYDPIYPCYVVGDRRAEETFEVMAAPAGVDVLHFDGASPTTEIAREYATVAVKVRLHQRRFRELVVAAYDRRCAVCALRHDELLDAAHILADKDERGRPEVPNGLALCKIHHRAFDSDILGISPDLRIAIRADILREIDGPMLKHGLQEMNDRFIAVPERAALRPKTEFLAERFERFRAA
jgi:putative restriction endonuclease